MPLEITQPAAVQIIVQAVVGGSAVSVAAALSPQAVNVETAMSPQAVNVATALSPQTVQVEAVSRVVPGGDGSPGDNAEIVVLTLAAYLALSPAVQMDGRWYVIPKV